MQKITVSVFINRSQQDVFDFLSDPANLSKWDSDFESAEWTSSDAPVSVHLIERQAED